ncbi:hypothetical protein [Fluviicola sp.]|uniref:hypothetical protein n=1 Tax=Fluviicola sp. TaxID=1917219 RepID=UPI0031D7D1FC
MRNYLSYLMAMGVCFLIHTSCTSPAATKHTAIIKNKDQAKLPASKPSETFRLAAFTREPETANPTFKRLRTQPVEPQPVIPEITDLEKLGALLAKYNPETEVFTIDPTEPSSVTSTNGTQVFFQESAFKDEQGNVVSEPVTIELKVCDNQLAFLANNLVTETSDGKLLESGGMIHIQALLNDQKLVLDPEKEAIVLFPKFGTNLDMQSFSGVMDGDLVKWNLHTPAPEVLEEPVVAAEISAKKDKSLHLRIHEFTAKLNEKDVNWMMENTDQSLLDWLEEQDINGTKLQSWLALPGRKIQTKLHLNRKGRIKLMESDLVAHEDILDELQRLFDKAPALDIKTMSAFYNQTSLFLSFTGKKGVSEDKIRNRVKRKYGKFKAELVDDFTAKELNNYILEVNQLGWHNCDHFKESDQKEDILVKGDQKKPVKVILVFDKFQAQLAGKQTLQGWKFEDIPLDQSVRVIAFSFDGDKPLMANQTVQLTTKELTISEFKPFSYNELEMAMKN